MEPDCACNELKLLMEEVSAIKKYFEERIDLCQMDSVKDRKRITRIEADIIKSKDALSQATATRTEGTWGIAGKRGDLIYARLFSMRNGNGKVPFLTTGDVKKILGVANYSQAKTALQECVKKHLDCRIVQRGTKKIGIELLEEIPVITVAPSAKHRSW